MTTLMERTGLIIVGELLQLTREMAAKSGDADFLVEGVEKRQKLMEEYDGQRDAVPVEDLPGIKSLIKEIMALDHKITASLNAMKQDAKQDLVSSQSKQKVLGYVNNAMARSGSYMDYKK